MMSMVILVDSIDNDDQIYNAHDNQNDSIVLTILTAGMKIVMMMGPLHLCW